MRTVLVSLQEFIEYLGKYYTKKALRYITSKYTEGQEEDYITLLCERIPKKEYEEHINKCYNCRCCVFRFCIEDEGFPNMKFTNVFYNGSSLFALWLCNFDLDDSDESDDECEKIVKRKKPIVKQLPYEYLIKNM